MLKKSSVAGARKTWAARIFGAALLGTLLVGGANATVIGYRAGTAGFGGHGAGSLFDGLFTAAGDTVNTIDFNNATAVNNADALWLSGGLNALNVTERSNVLSYLNAGGHVMYVTDRSDGGPWAASTNSLLSLFGADDIITGGNSATYATVGSNALIDGVANLRFNTWSAVNASLANPTLLTGNGMAALYQVGLGELLFIGDTNWQTGSFAAGTGNARFASNIVDWATADPVNVPEPGSFALVGIAIAGLGFARRRKF